MNARDIIEQLQTLDMQNPGAWPRWVHIMFCVLLALVILGAGGYFLVQPEYEQLGQEKQKELALRKEFEEKQQKVAALDAYKAQLEEMQHSFGDMLRQLPSKAEVAKLLDDISQTRIAASLEEELFQPQSDQPKDFYIEMPNRMVVDGSYHQMGQFVSGVAALPRIVVVDEVEIRPLENRKGMLHMSALVKTYRYQDDGSTPPPRPAANGGGKK
ncbi:MAG: type 4a pilus biogenesis protein PilO [Nevskia sp.]|nr:type 4a pilus biogenesis protein PilO [Nevskia sp.]